MKSQAYPLSGTQVLIVEDEFYLADDLARALADAGARVVGPVGTLQDADLKAAEGAFDCAVIDVNLRGENSFALAQRLKADGVPFVIATGYDKASIPQELQDVPRIEKPFTTAELIAALSKLPIAARSQA